MELQLKKEINSPENKVWNVLAHQFAEISEWAPNIESSRVLQMDEVPTEFSVAKDAPVPGRVTPNPLGELAEVLTQYSEENKTFTFEVTGPAPIFSHVSNTTSVVSTGSNKCLVTFDIKFTPKGIFRLLSPLLEKRLQTSLRGPAGMIHDLKNYLEGNNI